MKKICVKASSWRSQVLMMHIVLYSTGGPRAKSGPEAACKRPSEPELNILKAILFYVNVQLNKHEQRLLHSLAFV